MNPQIYNAIHNRSLFLIHIKSKVGISGRQAAFFQRERFRSPGSFYLVEPPSPYSVSSQTAEKRKDNGELLIWGLIFIGYSGCATYYFSHTLSAI